MCARHCGFSVALVVLIVDVETLLAKTDWYGPGRHEMDFIKIIIEAQAINH